MNDSKKPIIIEDEEVEEEKLPICENSSTAEHARLTDDGDACDDGRGN